MTRYRIVPDYFLGYEVQAWRWWWPFWSQHGVGGKLVNSHKTEADAVLWLKNLLARPRYIKPEELQ